MLPNSQLDSFELNLTTAKGWVHLNNKKKVSAFFSADQQVAMIRIPGNNPASYPLIPSGTSPVSNTDPSSGGAVKKLGYPAAIHDHNQSAKWLIQHGVEDFHYCVYAQQVSSKNDTLLDLTITSSDDEANPNLNAHRCC